MSVGDHHVYPVNDLIEHLTDGDECSCGPETIPIPRNDGSIGYVILHHSLDGREHFEEGHAAAGCPGCQGASK